MHIRLTLFGQTTWVHLIKILFVRPVPSFHLLARAGVTGGGGDKDTSTSFVECLWLLSEYNLIREVLISSLNIIKKVNHVRVPIMLAFFRPQRYQLAVQDHQGC